MKVGIVGFVSSGKTTVFNALTGLKAEVGSYSSRDKANLGIIKVPDQRVDSLASIYNTKKKTLAEISFVDIAGTKGGLETKTVNEMREVEALVQVVRDFESALHTNAPNPLNEINDFSSELILSDLILVENRLARMKKEKSINQREKELIEKCKEVLDSGRPLRDLELIDDEMQILAGYRFLSQKPLLVLLNVSEDKATIDIPSDISDSVLDSKAKLILMCGQAEMDIAELAPEEQIEFLKDLGISEPARDRFIRAAYDMLDLISFLTAGEDECRAWPIKRGIKAQRAAGKIHSDIERGFIRAEVVSFIDFMQYKSEAKCKEAGKLRLEGKEYIVQDGDIMHFRFNV